MRSLISLASVLILAKTVLAQTTPAKLTIPAKVISRVIVGDLTSDVSLAQQFKDATHQVQFSWDFTTNCYSEFRGDFGLSTASTPINNAQVTAFKKQYPPRFICGKNVTTLNTKGKCTTTSEPSFNVQIMS